MASTPSPLEKVLLCMRDERLDSLKKDRDLTADHLASLQSLWDARASPGTKPVDTPKTIPELAAAISVTTTKHKALCDAVRDFSGTIAAATTIHRAVREGHNTTTMYEKPGLSLVLLDRLLSDWGFPHKEVRTGYQEYGIEVTLF